MTNSGIATSPPLGYSTGNNDFLVSKIQSEDIIELSDDEDTTLKKSKTPQPKPKPVNKPSTSKIQANSSKANHKRTNGAFVCGKFLR